jgi:hypothetical protein
MRLGPIECLESGLLRAGPKTMQAGGGELQGDAAPARHGKQHRWRIGRSFGGHPRKKLGEDGTVLCCFSELVSPQQSALDGLRDCGHCDRLVCSNVGDGTQRRRDGDAVAPCHVALSKVGLVNDHATTAAPETPIRCEVNDPGHCIGALRWATAADRTDVGCRIRQRYRDPPDRRGLGPCLRAGQDSGRLFKFRSTVGLDVALEALRDYRQAYPAGMDDLWHYAKICRVSNVIRPYLEAIG